MKWAGSRVLVTCGAGFIGSHLVKKLLDLRCNVCVQDCVDGLILSMEKITDADSINLGSEEVVSINELVKKVIRLSRKNIAVKYDLSGSQTPLDEGLERTYEWAKRKLCVEG